MKWLRVQYFVFIVLYFCFPICNCVSGDELLALHNCKFVATDWSDGDSFRIEDAQGKQYTIRLYGVDCLEYHVNDTTDARRLRAQRRYFGIAKYGGKAESSIAASKQFGKQAALAVQQELKTPFTVHSAFADARGDGRFKRYYGFVTTSNQEDLGEKLVKLGLARAFGVYRQTPRGRTRIEYRDWLKDIELQAAKRGVGIWAATDWNALPSERRKAREEDAELALSTKTQPLAPGYKININTAPRDELMRLTGIGEVLANRIIEGRPYRTIDAIGEVEGIGRKKLAALRPNLKVKD